MLYSIYDLSYQPLSIIYSFLEFQDVNHFQQTAKNFYKESQASELFWKKACKERWPSEKNLKGLAWKQVFRENYILLFEAVCKRRLVLSHTIQKPYNTTLYLYGSTLCFINNKRQEHEEGLQIGFKDIDSKNEIVWREGYFTLMQNKVVQVEGVRDNNSIKHFKIFDLEQMCANPHTKETLAEFDYEGSLCKNINQTNEYLYLRPNSANSDGCVNRIKIQTDMIKEGKIDPRCITTFNIPSPLVTFFEIYSDDKMIWNVINTLSIIKFSENNITETQVEIQDKFDVYSNQRLISKNTLTFCNSNKIFLCDLKEGQIDFIQDFPSYAIIHSLAGSSKLLAGDISDKILLWDLLSKERVLELKTELSSIYGLQLTKDKLLAYGSTEVHIWTIKKSKKCVIF